MDFESIIGLDLRGSASTSSCERASVAYRKDKDGNVLHGNMDDSTEGILPTTQEDDNFAQFQEVETDTKEGARVSTETACLVIVTSTVCSNDGCRTRIRLTPSEPSKAGSMWHSRPVAVFLGFETKFTFQITDQSRTCTLVKDRQFSTSHHQSCMVHGGDGLALFCMEPHPAPTLWGRQGRAWDTGASSTPFPWSLTAGTILPGRHVQRPRDRSNHGEGP